MRNGVRSFAAALLMLSAFFLAAQAAVSLTILHTNDTHGHILPFSYPSTVQAGSTEGELSVRKDIGGIARRATLVHQIRDELKAKGTTVWLIDAGDICDGSPFSTEYHGEADVAAMNAAGYDMATLGNHEFNNTLAQTMKLIHAARYQMLCANAIGQDGKSLAAPDTVRMVEGVRIGIFGLVTPESATYPAAKEGVTIGDPITVARSEVAALQAKADIIVLISHCGERTDEKIAQAVPGIDVIVGGHSHTRLPVGELMWHSDDLKPQEINGTIIVQAFQWGGELGRLDLLLEKDDHGAWRVDRYHERLLPITSSIADDPAVAAVVDHYWKPIAAQYAEVVGQAAGDFSDRGDDLAEYNLMADAIRDAFGTEIEMENMGGVRAPLIQGPITRADLVTLDPFNNTVVTFKIKGSDLRQLLLSAKPEVSGLRYHIENGALTEVTVGGQPLDDNRVYTGASNSYFSSHHLQAFDPKDSGKQRLEVLTSYIKTKGTIHPSYDGRRVVIAPAEGNP